jgi:hypothetical protein
MTKFYGSASFAFEGIPMTFVIRNSMHEPKNYMRYTNFVMAFLAVLYVALSGIAQFVPPLLAAHF